MTYLKLTTVGDATAVVLPDDLLAQLGVGPEGGLEATVTPDGGVLLKATDAADPETLAVARDVMSRYRNTLRALSK